MTDPGLPPDGIYSVRRGVVAAPHAREGAVIEIGLLPFQMIVPEYRIAFDMDRLLRAGADLKPVDVLEALAPLRDRIDDDQVRLTEVSEVGDLQVRAALDVDLVVLLDHASDTALDGMPFPVTAPRGVLSDIIHWTVFYSSDILAPWLADANPSVIRTCALAGLALDPGDAVRPLGYLLAAHRARFPELSWEPPDASS